MKGILDTQKRVKMNWRRWHRVINIAMALALAAMFTMLPSLSSPVSASPDQVILRPSGVGDETTLIPYPGTGEANWEDVSEAISEGDSNYVWGDPAQYDTDLYALTDPTVSVMGKINSVTVYVNCRGTAAGDGAMTRIKTGGTAWNGSEIILTTSYVDTYNTAYSTNPTTTNEWTWAEINALQAGVGLAKPAGGAESRCTQVWVVVDYTPATLESYDDALQTTIWGTEADPYGVGTQTAFVYGPNFTVSHSYDIAYYDASASGTWIATHSTTSGAGNTLSSSCDLTTDPGATEGWWHAVVFDTDLGTPPATYSLCTGAAGYVGEDDFKVLQEAIPEFSTVIASIMVTGLCFGIYYWMRKRRLAHVKA